MACKVISDADVHLAEQKAWHLSLSVHPSLSVFPVLTSHDLI